MRVLTYHKNFQQRVYCYCFDMIDELKERIAEDQKELKFFEELQKLQHRCIACHGEGTIRTYYDQNESTVEKCRACNGTGQEGNDPLSI